MHHHLATAVLGDRGVQLSLFEQGGYVTTPGGYVQQRAARVGRMPRMIDKLDASLIKLLSEQPRVGLLEIARQLGVARGTVSARLDKLLKRGVITGFGPEIDPHALGFRILAF